ncbi:MAG: hypothetical protein IJ529_01885 [Alphaproteobacteria bacterium]|nr:hypothetical protein [Alphaproteobacteria bacterium]MBR1600039.1 hypothetical protein [Alphaproteobacteria bacterium]
MTQRIFDVENEKDMADLWDILPDNAVCINFIDKNIIHIGFKDDETLTTLIKINWHDKTEITRPMPEAKEADVGKLCKFWNNDGTISYGVLSDLITSGIKSIKYGCCYGKRWTHARRLTKQEIEELC